MQKNYIRKDKIYLINNKQLNLSKKRKRTYIQMIKKWIKSKIKQVILR